MMTLSTMWRGAHRLDEPGQPPVASLVLARWPHDAGSCEPFRYSANFLFTFTDDGQRRFLRVAAGRERQRPAIAAELDLLVWLVGEGLTIAAPIASRDGNLIETIESGHGTYHGVVFPTLAGDQRELDDLDETGFTVWGAALGRLQAALRRYQGVSAGARWSWRDQMALIEANIPATKTAVRREANDLAAALAALPTGPAYQGLIHFDFELDNLIWNEERLGILDFDDCAHHWYAADIAFALRDLFDHGAGAADRRVQAFLAGYAAHQPVDNLLLSMLPVFSRLARLTTYARITRSLDVPPDADPPPWIVDLQDRLRQRARRYETSLASEPSSA